MKRTLAFLLFVALAAVGGWYGYQQLYPQQRFAFRSASVERRPFLASVNASGTLVPVETIDVGSEIAGRIEQFGFDPRYQLLRDDLIMAESLVVFSPGPLHLSGAMPIRYIDNRSPVEKGTVLAQIDSKKFEIRVKKAQADLDKSKADLELAQAKHSKASEDWRRAQELFTSKTIAEAEFDKAKGTYDETSALVKQYQAAITQQQPLLEEAEYNLEKTIIRSNVRGIILDRRVNVGQTVVASLNAPSLFLIATDLNRLKIVAQVNEVDVNQIRPGQEVRFTLDGLPQDEFVGYVPDDQPAYNVTFTNNVVTYPVLVFVDNVAGKLKPYQTVNVKFVQTQKSNALVVPNGALRWRPHHDQVADGHREAYRKAAKHPKSPEQQRADLYKRTVWVADDGFVKPVTFQIGLSDGSYTEILAGDVEENDLIVTGEESRGDAGGSPFAPNMYGQSKKSN